MIATYDETWCADACDYLKHCDLIDDYRCTLLNKDLDYYDGPLAWCLVYDYNNEGD